MKSKPRGSLIPFLSTLLVAVLVASLRLKMKGKEPFFLVFLLLGLVGLVGGGVNLVNGILPQTAIAAVADPPVTPWVLNDYTPELKRFVEDTVITSGPIQDWLQTSLNQKMGLVIDLLKILSAELIIILPAMIGLLALMLYRKNPTTVVNPITDLHQSTSSELSDLYHQTTAVKNGLTQIVDPSPQQPLAWLRRYQTPILSPGLPRLPQKSPPRWLHPDNHRFPALPAAHNGVNHPRDARDELAKSLFHSPVKQSLSDLSDLGDLPSVLLEAIDLPIVEGLAPTYEETQQTSADSVTALEADDAPQPDHKSVVSAEYYIRRGNFLFLRHQYHEAIAWYQRAIHINPDHYMAWFSKGFALTQLQHYDEALKAYDQVIQLKESYHLAWYNRGKVLEELQQYGDALASYQKALELRSELSR